MNILITGCSWIQRMKNQKHLVTDGMSFRSFGGQGLCVIENHLNKCDTDNIDYVFLQLPTPIRNNFSMSTTERFKEFVSDIKKMGEDGASKKWLDSYKQKIIDINKLHDNIIFFIYNVGGYPFRHPYDFGKSIDKQMLDFFEENGLKSIYLSFEGQANYGIVEEICNDEEFWEYYHINNPKNRSDKDFKKYWSLISPKGWISIDPHPNSKADELAIKLMLDYVNEREKKV
jgi:hypothetical protein|tara:strand:- start:330 stop:1019 length:690 start_codon:yes stop_codon:yes gene_type:complete